MEKPNIQPPGVTENDSTISFVTVTCRTQNTYSSLLHSQLADVYGNVFCIRLGRHKTVFVSGWKMVKETLVTQADNFVDRPYSPMVTRIYSGNSGQHRNAQLTSIEEPSWLASK